MSLECCREETIHIPGRNHPTPAQEIPAIPPDLARSLDRDGVQALWRFHHRDDHGEHLIWLAKSVDWYKYLPGLVAHTLIDNIWAYQEGKADGVSEVSEAMGEDEDQHVRYSVLLLENNALMKARIADLERQLRHKARGEKVQTSASIAPSAPRAPEGRSSRCTVLGRGPWGAGGPRQTCVYHQLWVVVGVS
jgi:hypothetical protein